MSALAQEHVVRGVGRVAPGARLVAVTLKFATRRVDPLHRGYAGEDAGAAPVVHSQDGLRELKIGIHARCRLQKPNARDFRGLRVWLPIKLFGIEPFRQQLDEKLDLIGFVTSELRKIDGIEIVAEPQLTITAFRLNKPGADRNAITRELLERINAKKRVMLTPTIYKGEFLIRICIVSLRTHRDRIEMGLDDIRDAVAEVAASPSSLRK